MVLEDDNGFFPPYDAAPLVRGATLARHPEVGAVLGLLAGAFDEDRMRAFNFRLQEKGESEAVVARDALRELGLIGKDRDRARRRPARRPASSATSGSERSAIGRRTLEHLGLSALALALGVLVSVPLGLWLERTRRGAEAVIRLLGLFQTVPSLALLAFFVPFLGVGIVPALVALWLYSLFPIVRNTYTGVRDADPRAVEAATALGMTPGQVLRQVRLPLAAPIILAGIRTAAVITVGTATLAAFIGAGGPGRADRHRPAARQHRPDPLGSHPRRRPGAAGGRRAGVGRAGAAAGGAGGATVVRRRTTRTSRSLSSFAGARSREGASGRRSRTPSTRRGSSGERLRSSRR